ncbi:unnamed protein product [Lactuca virosa]|uniref:Apple domain-containing protein n=1 Tax=Lactuca virosa TaxID=75947 RepID=A0AAU9LGA3_9ASTR|nr:unnamed protein product [Lactuca virosa]
MSRRPFPRRRLCLRAYDCSTITVEVQYTRSLADCKCFKNMQCRNLYLLQASNDRCMMSTKRRTGKRRQRQRTLALLVVPLLHPPSSIQGRRRPLGEQSLKGVFGIGKLSFRKSEVFYMSHLALCIIEKLNISTRSIS